MYVFESTCASNRDCRVDAVLKEAAGRSVEQLAREENSVLSGLLKLRLAASA
jgi:hypothetical protein